MLALYPGQRAHCRPPYSTTREPCARNPGRVATGHTQPDSPPARHTEGFSRRQAARCSTSSLPSSVQYRSGDKWVRGIGLSSVSGTGRWPSAGCVDCRSLIIANSAFTSRVRERHAKCPLMSIPDRPNAKRRGLSSCRTGRHRVGIVVIPRVGHPSIVAHKRNTDTGGEMTVGQPLRLRLALDAC